MSEQLAALVIDAAAVRVLSHALVTDEWFEDFDIKGFAGGLQSIQKGSRAYILTKSSNEATKLLVIDLRRVNFGDQNLGARDAFSRIMHVALNHFEERVSIPTHYQTWRDGSRLSVFANSIQSGTRLRLHFERCPGGDDNLFLYALAEGVRRRAVGANGGRGTR